MPSPSLSTSIVLFLSTMAALIGSDSVYRSSTRSQYSPRAQLSRRLSPAVAFSPSPKSRSLTLPPSPIAPIAIAAPQTTSDDASATDRTAVSRLFGILLESLRIADGAHPISVRQVSPRLWAHFRTQYSTHAAFSGAKWEYDDVRCKIIAIPLASPFHDMGVKIMTQQIFNNRRDQRLGSSLQLRNIFVDRENCTKRSTTGPGQSQREPDCAVWATGYHGGIVPTIIWEVGVSQKRTSLLRRAKMWCRRYNGLIRVVVLVKYLRRDPRVDNAAILEVYRPGIRESDGRWTAVQDGPTYQQFPRPPTAVRDDYANPVDAVPLTREDYWGPGNAGAEPAERFDLPLELVREVVETLVPVTVRREQFRFPSDGSSVLGEGDEEGGEGREAPVPMVVAGEPLDEAIAFEWDAAMSDVSDD